MAPSRLSAQAIHIANAIGEVQRNSESNGLSRSVRTTFRKGQFGSGLSSRGSPGETARSEGVVDRLPHHWPLS